MRDMSFGRDATFSELALAERINSDLANDLGNLLHRTMGMVGRYQDGVLHGPGELGEEELNIREKALGLAARVREDYSSLKFSQGLEAILDLVRSGNKYIDSSEPWKLAKQANCKERLATVLYTSAELLRIVSVLLDSIMPWKMERLRQDLGLAKERPSFSEAERWGGIEAGSSLAPASPLFPRIDVKALKEQLDDFAASKAKSAKSAKSGKSAKSSKSGNLSKKEGSEEVAEISFGDFQRVKLIVVEIKACEKVEGADRLLKISIDAASKGEATVLAGLAPYYSAQELVGKRAVWVSNLAPRKMRGHVSQGMLLASETEDGSVKLLEPSPNAELGGRIS